MANKNSKPTNKQRDVAISKLINKTNELADGLTKAYDILRQLDIILGMYVDFKGDKDKFDKHIVETQEKLKKEKDDAETDGDADKPNLQGDTDGEVSGTEGIRKEEK